MLDPKMALLIPIHTGSYSLLAHLVWNSHTQGLPRWFIRKESACNAGDTDFIPGLGRSPGGRHDNPLHYSCLGNPMNRGAWVGCIHGLHTVRHSWSDWTRMCIDTQKDDIKPMPTHSCLSMRQQETLPPIRFQTPRACRFVPSGFTWKHKSMMNLLRASRPPPQSSEPQAQGLRMCGSPPSGTGHSPVKAVLEGRAGNRPLQQSGWEKGNSREFGWEKGDSREGGRRGEFGMYFEGRINRLSCWMDEGNEKKGWNLACLPHFRLEHLCGRSISMSPLTSGGKTIHLVLAFWGLRSFGYPSRQLQLGGWHSRERWVSEIEILSHL